MALPFAIEIINIYNVERARVVGPGKEIPVSKRLLEDAQRVASFVRSHRIDPKLWIKSQFTARGWRHSVRLKSMATEKSMERYREFGERLAAEEAGQDRLQDRCVDDERRDGTSLTPLAEATKRAYAASPRLCMAQTRTVTLGWTPASPSCQRCSLAVACRAALPPALMRRRDTGARRIRIRT